MGLNLGGAQLLLAIGLAVVIYEWAPHFRRARRSAARRKHDA